MSLNSLRQLPATSSDSDGSVRSEGASRSGGSSLFDILTPVSSPLEQPAVEKIVLPTPIAEADFSAFNPTETPPVVAMPDHGKPVGFDEGESLFDVPDQNNLDVTSWLEVPSAAIEVPVRTSPVWEGFLSGPVEVAASEPDYPFYRPDVVQESPSNIPAPMPLPLQIAAPSIETHRPPVGQSSNALTHLSNDEPESVATNVEPDSKISALTEPPRDAASGRTRKLLIICAVGLLIVLGLGYAIKSKQTTTQQPPAESTPVVSTPAVTVPTEITPTEGEIFAEVDEVAEDEFIVQPEASIFD